MNKKVDRLHNKILLLHEFCSFDSIHNDVMSHHLLGSKLLPVLENAKFQSFSMRIGR